jgi:hypothetical protein
MLGKTAVKWVLPLLIASLYFLIAPIWNLMLRRWTLSDWKELFFGFLLCVGVSYFFFFSYPWLKQLGVPLSAVAVLVSIGGVVLIGAFRKRLDRKER